MKTLLLLLWMFILTELFHHEEDVTQGHFQSEVQLVWF